MNDSFSGMPILGVGDLAEDYGAWLIHGPQGSGKTTLASTVAGLGKTLFVDLVGERGTRVLRGSPYEKNISIIRPASVQALDDLFWDLAKGDHDFSCVVIDSATSVQKLTMRFLMGHDETAVREIRQGAAPADQRTWGQALDVMTDMATYWFGLKDIQRKKPMHVVMTAQSKVSDNEFTGQTNYVPDVQKGALSLFLASPDYIVFCDVEDNPDAIADDKEPPVHHIIHFGSNPTYRTKARIPQQLRGKIPPILGRSRSPSLVDLSRVLGIGGVPPAPK